MATLKQKELAEAIIANHRLPKRQRKNKKELLVSTGYAVTTAETEATEIIESKGVKQALAEFGLTQDLIATSLVDDIKNKPKRRFHELNLGAEILGMKKKEVDPVSQNTTTNNFIQIVIKKPDGLAPTGNQPNA